MSYAGYSMLERGKGYGGGWVIVLKWLVLIFASVLNYSVFFHAWAAFEKK